MKKWKIQFILRVKDKRFVIKEKEVTCKDPETEWPKIFIKWRRENRYPLKEVRGNYLMFSDKVGIKLKIVPAI